MRGECYAKRRWFPFLFECQCKWKWKIVRRKHSLGQINGQCSINPQLLHRGIPHRRWLFERWLDSCCAGFSKSSKPAVKWLGASFLPIHRDGLSRARRRQIGRSQHRRLTCTMRWSSRRYRERRMCRSLLRAGSEQSPCWESVRQVPLSSIESLISVWPDGEPGSLLLLNERCWRAARRRGKQECN